MPFSVISDQDVAWVQKQPKPVEITQAHLDAILAYFPRAAAVAHGEVTNELNQLQLRYLSMVKFIRPATIPANLKMIRSKIESDIKVLEEIAKTRGGDYTGRRGSGHSQASENTILSARSSLDWLQGSLTPYLKQYDSLQNEALSGILR